MTRMVFAASSKNIDDFVVNTPQSGKIRVICVIRGFFFFVFISLKKTQIIGGLIHSGVKDRGK